MNPGKAAQLIARAAPGAGAAPLILPPSLIWILLIYAALLLLSGWTYSALRIRTDREHTVQAERNRLSIIAVALETGAHAMLNDGIGAALTGANEITAAGGLDAATDAVLRSRLQRVLTGGEYVRSVFVADAKRFARAGRTGVYEVSDVVPAWLTATLSPTSAGSWVGKPVPDPDHPGEMVVPVARHVPHQRPDLWAGALFSFRAFEPLHAQLGGPGGVIALLATDGTLLVGMQDGTSRKLPPGTNYASSPLFRAASPTADSGVVEGLAPALGTQMIVAFVRLQDYPMTVITGLPRDSILAPWRERTRTTLIVTAVPSALVLALTVFLSHFLQALRQRELHYRTLFNNAAFSVLLLENEHFVAANETAVRMFGVASQQAVLGMTPWMLSPPRQPDGRESQQAARERIAEALRRGGTTFEWQHKRLDSGEEFPAEVDLTTLSTGKANLALAVVHDLTERKRAEQERRESEERYRALVDALPEAVFVHRGQALLFGNEAAVRLVGAQPGDLTGRSVLSFADEADREVLAERTRQLLEHGIPAEPREARVRRMDGSMIWVEVQGVRVQFAGAPAVQSVMRDITAHKRRQEAEAARVERRQRQSGVLLQLASANESLQVICESAAGVLGVDRAAIWLLQEDAGTLACAELHERGHARGREGPALLTRHFPRYLGALRGERVVEAGNLHADPRLAELLQPGSPFTATRSIIAAAVRRAGELAGVVTFEQLDTARAWQPDETNFAAGVADQVAQALLDAEREQMLADLRVLAGELTRSQDEERRRIGRDLHDSTGQTLVALELELARLAESARTLAPAQRALLEDSVRLAHQCSAEIRTASYLLHPPLLDELGLVSALRWLADGLRQRGAMEVRLELPASMARARPEEELTLFRVAQEALTNAHRHSASPWVAIRLTESAAGIRLEVEDAGRGIRGRRLTRGAAGEPALGVGLAGMRERIRQVGGTFAVESTGAGTRISATCPGTQGAARAAAPR
ncbi:MAG TPA: PAS domain S-box protein [Steroidobacteraceae bacterium]|nr:PAS domain S-box protein [Steroidobacteraceae bacterium]